MHLGDSITVGCRRRHGVLTATGEGDEGGGLDASVVEYCCDEPTGVDDRPRWPRR